MTNAAAGASSATRPRILHLHSTFSAGGKEVRCTRLMNLWGERLQHSIVSAEPGAMAAAALVEPHVPVDYPQAFPSLKGQPTPARLAAIARAMQGYDLVCTYNWGAMDAVMAHRIYAGVLKLPALIHHEDGFNEDEAERLSPKRNLFRRAALGRAAALIVPSSGLADIARDVWHQPDERLLQIPNGIDTAAFAAAPDPAALPIRKRDGQFWVGTLAGLRAVKRLPDLVEAFSALPPAWHLVICGDGPERAAILAAAQQRGVAARVHLPGNVEPAKVVGLFDILALSSASEQFPLSVVEAMAAARPVAAPDVGDIRAMVAEENRDYIAPAGDVPALARALGALASDRQARARIGEANAARARASFDIAAMRDAYEAAYASAMGRTF